MPLDYNYPYSQPSPQEFSDVIAGSLSTVGINPSGATTAQQSQPTTVELRDRGVSFLEFYNPSDGSDYLPALRRACLAPEAQGRRIIIPRSSSGLGYPLLNTAHNKIAKVIGSATEVWFERGAQVEPNTWGIPWLVFANCDRARLTDAVVRTTYTYTPVASIPANKALLQTELGITLSGGNDRDYTTSLMLIGCDRTMVDGLDHGAKTPGAFQAAHVILGITPRSDASNSVGIRVKRSTFNDFLFGIEAWSTTGLTLEDIVFDRYDQYIDAWAAAGHAYYIVDVGFNKDVSISNMRDFGTFQQSVANTEAAIDGFASFKLAGADGYMMSNLMSRRKHGIIDFRSGNNGIARGIFWNPIVAMPTTTVSPFRWNCLVSGDTIKNNRWYDVVLGDPGVNISGPNVQPVTLANCANNELHVSMVRDLTLVTSVAMATYQGLRSYINFRWLLSNAYASEQVPFNFTSTSDGNVADHLVMGMTSGVERFQDTASGANLHRLSYAKSGSRNPSAWASPPSVAGAGLIDVTAARTRRVKITTSATTTPSATVTIFGDGFGKYRIIARLKNTTRASQYATKTWALHWFGDSTSVVGTAADAAATGTTTISDITFNATTGIITFSGTHALADAGQFEIAIVQEDVYT
jgi:hypothetical protein